jgi:pantothenate kinase type III
VMLTGGDAGQLKKLLPDATINENLVFSGMQKILDKEPHTC